MNIPCLIEKACSPDDLREYMRTPILDVKGSRVIATDGAICADVPVLTTDEDVSGPIPVEALKEGRRMKGAPDCINAVTLNGSAKLPQGTTFPRAPMDVRHQTVIDGVDRLIAAARADTDRPADIEIDVALLMRLAEALKTPGAKHKAGLRLWLPRREDGSIDDTRPIYARPTHGDAAAHGLVMQLRR